MCELTYIVRLWFPGLVLGLQGVQVGCWGPALLIRHLDKPPTYNTIMTIVVCFNHTFESNEEIKHDFTK